MESREPPPVPPGDEVKTEDEKSEEHKENFFKREYKAFKAEKRKKFHDLPREAPTIDFDELIREFKGEGRVPEKHWMNFCKKRPIEKCPRMLFNVMVGFFNFLLSLFLVLLDFQAAYEYIGGSWYWYERDEKKFKLELERNSNKTCRNATSERTEEFFGLEFLRQEYDYREYSKHVECFERDLPWGALTLTFAFLSGVFWSARMFYRLWTYLTEKDRAFYGRKTMLFFFFVPLSIMSVATFPLQHVLINFIAVFNVQDQWTLLTWKLGIAEGLYNAHFQYVLQYFITCVAAERQPTKFQTVLIVFELLEIPSTRIESLLLDRGGHRMSPGQKLWWFLRFGPGYTFNSLFKVTAIGAIIAMLRFNSIWFYGGLFLIWLLLQILFIEQKIPRKFYYLLLGAGKHSVTVAHVPQYVQIIGTDRDTGKTVLWSCRLNSREIQTNIRFHNMLWFILNTVIISSVLISERFIENKPPIQVFWPFTPSNTYKISNQDLNMDSLKLTAIFIIISGAISQLFIWCLQEEFTYTDDANPSSRRYKGWHYVETDSDGRWHKYEYDQDLRTGVQGRAKQIIYQLFNIWENFGDQDMKDT